MYIKCNYILTAGKTYSSNLKCNWTISLTPKPGKRVNVGVYVYGLGKNDNLTIYSGDYSSNNLIGDFTNIFRYYETFRHYFYISDAWTFLITFNSDYKNGGRGFFVTFNERPQIF